MLILTVIVAGTGYFGLVGIGTDVATSSRQRSIDEAGLAASIEIKFLKVQKHVAELRHVLQHQKGANVPYRNSPGKSRRISTRLLKIVTAEKSPGEEFARFQRRLANICALFNQGAVAHQ